jgi:cellulose synthase/poly-beta-1,6-N-acetylglucosamine synthase-like glycosyltransferase
MERKMIKIFISVRNRLAMTKKCIEALKKHSKLPHHIYVYDNASTYKLDEHFQYFYQLYKKKDISQITFTTEPTTFNAFSKASTSNFFGRQHEEDPNKDKYLFLVLMDNDIVVTPGWDLKIRAAWEYIARNKMNHIKIVGQRPGGIKSLEPDVHKID